MKQQGTTTSASRAMMKSRWLLLAASLPVILSLCCSKKSSNPQPTSCQLASANIQSNGGSASVVTITYDGSGQIATEQAVITGATVKKVYSYSGSTVIMLETYNDSLLSTDTVTMNSYGLMATDLHTSYLQGTQQDVTTYTYSGNEVQKSVDQVLGAADSSSTVYTWMGHNMVSAARTDNGQTYTTSYTYNDSTVRTGDYWQVQNTLSYPMPFVANADMVTGFNASGQVTNIAYSWDDTGKVTAVTVTTGASVQNYSYDWSCH